MTRARDLADYISTGVSYTELDVLDGVTAGTVTASKALVVDANKDVASLRNITATGTITGNVTGDVTGTTATFTTSLNVDGTVTADGLTVDGSPVRFVSTAPMLHFMETGVTDSNHRIRQNTGNLYFQKLSDDENTDTTRMVIDGGSGDISFYEDTGTTAKLFWDASAESLGIGTASPESYSNQSSLTINGTSTGRLDLQGGGTTGGTVFSSGSNLTVQGAYAKPLILQSGQTADTQFLNNGTEVMRITQYGSVGIGTASGTQPSYFNSFLNVQNNGSTGSHASVTITSGSGGYAGLHFGDSDNGRIGQVSYNNSDNSLLFTANNSTRMTIDSSGKLLIGSSSSTFNGDAKIVLTPNSDSYFINNGQTLSLNRTSSDGAIVGFYKDQSGVGSIGAVNGNIKVSAYGEEYASLSGTSVTIDCRAGNNFALTTSGNTTFTFSNVPTSGTAFGFTLKLTSGGSHTITYPNTVDFAGATAPDAPASGETDVLVFYTVDGGTNWYGALAIDAAG